MNRRQFLQGALTVPVLSIGGAQPAKPSGETGTSKAIFRRVRPSDPNWPAAASWDKLGREVEGRLIRVQSPVDACRSAPGSTACAELFKNLKNPYYIGDEPGLTQTSGWVDGWTSAPSVYAVAAAKTEDVVAAVHFARKHNLRLVVKGGGHSYKGTSNSVDSLLIWTRAMNSVVVHDAFVAQNCAGRQAPQPAVTVGAGAIWLQAYNAVTTKAGRYVQGGGCTTVGVAGLIQSGGFGSFSKNYGTAAAGLLEAEVVTADGKVRIANTCTNADLFWGLKGGGGGSLGVVTRVTLRTRELPNRFGGVFGTIRAKSDAAFRTLISRLIALYQEQLFNRHWGEQIRFDPRNSVNISIVFQGLNRQQAMSVWQPFLDWVAARTQDYSFDEAIQMIDLPARQFWNAEYMRMNYPTVIIPDARPNAPAGNFLWSGDHGQVGWVIHGYESAWLPSSLLKRDQQSQLVDALFASSRFWSVSLHFNKGLAGAPPEELAAARDTATNPAVLDAFALAIIATGEGPAFPGIAGHEPNVTRARERSLQIGRAMDELLRVVRDAGSYVSESSFFEQSWQRSFWGSNYPKLAAVKKKYDPDGLFFVHHGVGGEDWSPDGFTRLR